MKTLAPLLAACIALGLGGCTTDDSLESDEEYNAQRGPAANAADPTGHIPQRGNYPMSGAPGY